MQTTMRGLFNKVVYHYTPTHPETKSLDERIAIRPPAYLGGVAVVILGLLAIASSDTTPAQQVEPGIFANVKWVDIAWLVLGSASGIALGLIFVFRAFHNAMVRADKKAAAEAEAQTFQAVLKHSPEPVREVVIKLLAEGKPVTLGELRAFTITYERLQKEEYAKIK